MSYSAVISEAWKLLKNGKKYLFYELIFSGGFLVVVYALLFLQQVFTISASSSKSIDGDYAAAGGILVFSVMLCFSLIGGFLTAVLETGIYKGFVEKYLNDKLFGFGATFKSGFKPLLKVFAATFLGTLPLYLLIGVLVIVGFVIGGATLSGSTSSSSNSTLAGLSFILICCGTLILLPISIMYSMFLTTVKNAILVDNMGVVESLSYSLKFVKKHLGKFVALFFVGVLLALVASIPAYCVGFVGGFFQGFFSASSRTGAGMNLFGELISLATQLISSIFALALAIYFNCYWIVSYVKLKKLGEPEVKPSEPVMAKA
jgi:hypothetical protein